MLTSNQICMKNTGSCLQEQDCPHLLIYLSNCILYANFKVMAYNVEILMKCTVISLIYINACHWQIPHSTCFLVWPFNIPNVTPTSQPEVTHV